MNKLTIIGHLTGAEIEVKTFDQNYILSNSEDFKKPVVSGVYVLMYRGNIIYVGSSMNVYKRIKSHKQKPRTMVLIVILYIQYIIAIPLYVIQGMPY